MYNYKARLNSTDTGLFLGPDPAGQFHSPYVGMGNNPVNYVDPDGEWVFLAAAVIGGAINLGMKYHEGKIDGWQDGFKAFGVGALAGVAGAWTGGSAFAMAGGAAGGAGGFFAGYGGAFVGSLTSTPILNVGNHLAFGDPLMSVGQHFQAATISGLFGGTMNGAYAFSQGRSFWNGNVSLNPIIPNAQPVATLNRALNTPTKDLPVNTPSARDIPGARQLGEFVDDGPVPLVNMGGREVNLLPYDSGSLPMQLHHFATNKHSIFTPQMTSIARAHGLSLNGSWNTSMMPHMGRHPHIYHDFVLRQMHDAARIAGGNQSIFLRIYDVNVRQYILQNPHLLRKSGW